jgi:hypothetical protein
MNAARSGAVAALAFVAALVSAARAAPPMGACREVRGIGCFYAPASLDSAPTLLVFIRGWYSTYKGDVPPARRLASSRQAFNAYELGTLAEQNQVAVLVVGSSSLGVSPADLASIASGVGLSFGRTILAAHSGGYAGLGASLTAGTTAARILMLDDWYDTSGTLAAQLQQAISAGASCAGYHTRHNKKNWEKIYKPAAACTVDDMGSDAEHDGGVRRCLGAYLTRASCF